MITSISKRGYYAPSKLFSCAFGEGVAELFFLVLSDIWKWLKAVSWKVQAGYKKNFFTEWLIKHCNRPAGKEIDTQSLSIFKRRLDNALNNVLHFMVSPYIVTELE